MNFEKFMLPFTDMDALFMAAPQGSFRFRQGVLLKVQDDVPAGSAKNIRNKRG
jgi:hypothetical protein